MTFRLPNFNDSANVWRNPGSGGCPTGNPDAIIACNLAHGLRTAFENDGGNVTYLLMPALSDVVGNAQVDGQQYGDIVEVPAYSGKVYRVNYVDNVGESFPNEHRICLINQSCAWPRPIPGGGQITPPVAGIITLGQALIDYQVIGGFSSWIHPVTVPTPGLLVLVSMMYQDLAVAMPLTASINTNPVSGAWQTIPLRVTEPAFVAGGVNAAMAVFSMPVARGNYFVRMEQPSANTKAAQAFVYLAQAIHDTTFCTDATHGTTSTPSITATSPPTVVPAVYLASFSVIQPGAGTSWSAPFNGVGTNQDVAYLALTIRGTNAVYTASGIGLPTAALGMITPVGWQGTLIGMS